MYITVDCGVTNMRCALYRGDRLIDRACRKAGVRNTAFDGTTAFLRQSLHDCIGELLTRNALTERNIEVIISSGTLASDVGIYPIPHVVAPVGVVESARAAQCVTIAKITSVPICFIPGVKVLPDRGVTDEASRIALWDSMSGEECEIYGIMAELGLTGNFTITLPGSYNKTLQIDGAGRIATMHTGMCGELIAAISEHTILRHALPQPLIQEILPEKLLQGFRFAQENGVSPAMIKARLVRFLGGWDEAEAANFFVGAALHDDIRLTARVAGDELLVLGGSNPLRTVFKILLEACGSNRILEVPDAVAKAAPSIGAMAVYEAFKELRTAKEN